MKKRPQVRGRISKEAEEDYSRFTEERRPAERAAWVEGSRTLEEDQTHLRPLFLVAQKEHFRDQNGFPDLDSPKLLCHKGLAGRGRMPEQSA